MTNSDDEITKRLRIGRSVVSGLLSSDRSFAHYGVKGMHWGIRKEDKTGSGSDASTQKWKKAHKPKNPSEAEVKRNLAKNEKKSLAKLEGDGPAKQSFVAKNKKTLIKVGVAAGVVGGLYLSGKVWEAKTLKSIQENVGKDISAQDFKNHVNYSKMKTWGKNDYLHDSSFEREEFTLPAGHTFHRLSQKAETEFRGATYSTHNQDDLHRYIAQFRGELGGDLHHVTFQANEDIRVPKLSTTLESLKESLIGGKEEFRSWYTDERVLAKYQDLSGGSWDDNHAEGMFSSLRKKGYGAIVDEMDAGVIGESPLVIFARDLVGKKSSTPLTDDAIANAESSLVELSNRKY